MYPFATSTTQFETFSSSLRTAVSQATRSSMEAGATQNPPHLFGFHVFRATRKAPLDPRRPPCLPLQHCFGNRFGTPRQPQVTASVAGGAPQEGQLVFFKGHGYGKLRAGEGVLLFPHSFTYLREVAAPLQKVFPSSLFDAYTPCFRPRRKNKPRSLSAFLHRSYLLA